MISPSDIRRDSRIRTYDRLKSIVFLKTKEEFGGLSNMAGGFPLLVNGIRILTSEALYQACRFPHMPEVQQFIIAQISPMTAKMKSKPYQRESRPDWNRVRVKIMRWCLRVKLAQNWSKFSQLLLATGNHPIVEQSRKDDFWGAKPVDTQTLVGMNVLGRLLMELREEVRNSDHPWPLRVEPLLIPDFLLNGQPIQPMVGDNTKEGSKSIRKLETAALTTLPRAEAAQAVLFDQSSPRIPTVPKGLDDNGRQALIHNLKPYPTYKDSGAHWLGPVPEHWEVRRNGRLFTQRNETAFPDLPILEVSLKTGVRVRSFDASSRKQLMSDRGKYKRAAAGDIAYNMMRMWQGAVGVSTVDGLVSPSYVVARPLPGTEARYFASLFRTALYMGEVNNVSRGIVPDRNRLYWDDFKQITSLYPPAEEQSAIVRFLDHSDRRIQRYIHTKKKLIALLNEQKQAIIHHAVTRGLDPNVRLKPSGVEWLGDVPEHWDKVTLGRCLRRIDQGWSPVAAEGEITSDQWAVLTLSAVKRGAFNAAAIKPVPTSARVPDGIEIMDGDLLLTRSNTRERVGDVCIVQGARPKTVLCDLIYRLNVNPTLFERRFLMYQLLSPLGRQQIQGDARGSSGTMPKISQRHIRAWNVVAPPLDEQLRIVAAIEGTGTDIDEASLRAETEISLFREYRTRLIADVVTGKLDVREAAARLPDEEPESLGEAEALAEGDEEGNDADLDDACEEANA